MAGASLVGRRRAGTRRSGIAAVGPVRRRAAVGNELSLRTRERTTASTPSSEPRAQLLVGIETDEGRRGSDEEARSGAKDRRLSEPQRGDRDPQRRQDEQPLARTTLRRLLMQWVQAADQYVLLHVEEDSILVRKSMGDLERLLDPARFPRVHRSAIVALDRVTRLESLGGGTGRLLLRDGTWVPVSRSRVAAIRRLLG